MGLHARAGRRRVLRRVARAPHRACSREPGRAGALIVTARRDNGFASVEDLWRRAGVPLTALERLAEADAFGSLGLSRRQARWEVRALGGEPLPLFAAADAGRAALRPEVDETPVALAPMTAGREVVEDYRSRGLTLRSHPVAFLRRDLAASGYVPAADLGGTRDGRPLSVAGLAASVQDRPMVSCSSRSKTKRKSQT